MNDVDTPTMGNHQTMKSSKPKGLHRPFERLKALLENASFVLRNEDAKRPLESFDSESDAQNDRALFEEAMADVERISQNLCAEQNYPKCAVSESEQSDDDTEALLHLEQLVETGKGFVVADTAEYVEGIGYNVNREVAKRLHKGEFSVQAHIDLHGLTVEQARQAFEHFLRESTATGKRMVLIVHGRGLSSPAAPILKSKVIEWLSTGPWRKWVMAFTSARLCDGGTGATYVLLRKRPATRRFKKNRKSDAS
jgi:DNA-nicking Smr family endonuclease